MLKLVAALGALLCPTAAISADWVYEDAEVPIAYVDNGAAQLQFACRGGDLALGFWVRMPQKQVAAASSMNLAITPDPATGSAGSVPKGSSFAQDMPLIHSDGSSMIVRGPVARQWAQIAQRAKTGLQVAYVRHNAKGALEVFDSNAFGASGSAAAIKQLFGRCK